MPLAMVTASRRVGTTAAAGRSATVWAGAGALASDAFGVDLDRMAVDAPIGAVAGARGERARGLQPAPSLAMPCRRPRRPPPGDARAGPPLCAARAHPPTRPAGIAGCCPPAGLPGAVQELRHGAVADAERDRDPS